MLKSDRRLHVGAFSAEEGRETLNGLVRADANHAVNAPDLSRFADGAFAVR